MEVILQFWIYLNIFLSFFGIKYLFMKLPSNDIINFIIDFLIGDIDRIDYLLLYSWLLFLHIIILIVYLIVS